LLKNREYIPVNEERKTVAIIGGGPAASATAISLIGTTLGQEVESTRSFDVHIFSALGMEALTNKTYVGESIPPAATSIMKQLKVHHLLDNTEDHIPCPGSISLWNNDVEGHNDFFMDPMGFGYHLDRRKFDHQLLDQAKKAGANVHRGWRFNHVDEETGKYALTFSVQGRPRKLVKIDFVVDASGRSSAFVRRLGVARNTFDEVLFVNCTFDLSDDAVVLDHSFVEAVSDGWWYAARIPNNKLIVTLCTDISTIKVNGFQNPAKWLALLKQTKWISKAIPSEILDKDPFSLDIIMHAASSSILSAVCGGNWLAVGDAASSYDPITSAGITKALIQGEMAGKAIKNLISGSHEMAVQNYQESVFDDFNRFVKLRDELYKSETRFPTSPFWQRRN